MRRDEKHIPRTDNIPGKRKKGQQKKDGKRDKNITGQKAGEEMDRATWSTVIRATIGENQGEKFRT